MEDLEKTQRLKEILAKLDPRAETRVREGGLFKSAELLRRKLVHEGNLLWKTPGSRHKGTLEGCNDTVYIYSLDSYSACVFACLCLDVQVLLMTDILVFLQEKDQRYIFSCLVSKAHITGFITSEGLNLWSVLNLSIQ